MPIYPLPVIIKTVFPVIGVAVTTAYPLTVELTYVTTTDVQPAQSLTVNITYTYTVTVT